MVTNQDKALFQKLYNHRKKLAGSLDDPAFSGVKASVVEKYSDLAHFIYELLQNADDVRATKVKFILNPDSLIYIHNGEIRFTLSDVDAEKRRQKSDLGHINSITSIGNSNKDENKIGKFGVGFKSVFQYTNTPHIYDQFCFKIENFIVPVLLDTDFLGKTENETIFLFPFDKPDKPPEECFREILKKISNLSNPILFLNNLTEISWETGDNERSGSYAKQIVLTKQYQDILVKQIKLFKDGNIDSHKIYLFTKFLNPTENDLAYRIAYRFNEENEVIYNRKVPAYCFFETQEQTNLKFFVNAPFLLTDNREGIRKGEGKEKWNQEMIHCLAELTAESLPICRDLGLVNDNFFNVLPIIEEDFKYSQFAPIYEAVLEKLNDDTLLPVNNGERFTHSKKAYLADGKELIDLFNLPSNNGKRALEVLTEINDAEWVFTTVTKRNSSLWKYINDKLVKDVLTPEKIARRLNKEFIEQQTDSWLIEFYSYVSNIYHLWKEGSEYRLRYKEIIRLEDNSLVVPFDEYDDPQAYLPTEGSHSLFPTVKQCFVEDPKSLEFLKDLGLSKPKRKDAIIPLLKKYEDAGLECSVLDSDLLCEFSFLKDFEEFFLYFCESQDKTFLDRLKKTGFLIATCIDQEHQKFPGNENKKIGTVHLAKDIYFNDQDLINYFDGFSIDVFDKSFYKDVYSKHDEEKIDEFLESLGINTKPKIISFYHPADKTSLTELNLKFRLTQLYGIVDYKLHGLENCLSISRLTPEKSHYLWKYLRNMKHYYTGFVTYFYRMKKTQYFQSHFFKILQDYAWLYDKQGNVFRPSEIIIENLADEYELDGSEELISELQILSQEEKEIQERELSLEEKIQQRFPDLTEEDILSILEKTQEKQTVFTGSSGSGGSPANNSNQGTYSGTSIDRLSRQLAEGANKKAQETQKSPTLESNQPELDTEAVEQDDYIPPTVDTEKQVQKLKDELETEIAELNRKEELKSTVSNSDKYSFIWFKALLDLEYEAPGESRAKKNPIQVKFSKVEWDTNSQEVLVLSGTNYIPYSIEDNGELSVTLNFKHDTPSILVEAVSPRKNILKAKVKNPASIHHLDLSKIENAVVEVKNADFILENLRDAFKNLVLSDEYNLRDNLTSNIRFIFGPPGTGKTTYLATQEILPKITNGDQKILVLTPTNKAADVLAEAIIRECTRNNDDSYYNWLIRYGLTQSPQLEKTVFTKSKYLDRSIFSKGVITTTIARFPYDNFKVENTKGEDDDFPIKNFNWDYIIFDEASMISLASILYVFYYVTAKNPECKFVVAGDPFQLSPVIQVEQEGWKDGNIYSLVNLNQEDSFIDPQTTPYEFEVVNLSKQYRSILQLGSLFSEFRYNGHLEHHRPNTDIKTITINNLPLKPLTIINFKVSQFESLYKPRKIKGSPYQIYSALLTVELVQYILENITLPEGEGYRIGIICPYRLQRSIIDKLLVKIPVNPEIELITGTIHGFQGDECDMILNVLNPPISISSSENIFLNKKNLLNVSISRAKDHLILFLPHDEAGYLKTKNLLQIEAIKQLIYGHNELCHNYAEFDHDEIEQIIFGQSGMIEELSFATSHQSVNVYSNPDKKYEIRYDENAVDIQLRLNYESK